LIIFHAFLLAISLGVRTVGVHEACQAICRPRIFVGLLCCDRCRTGATSGRSTGQSGPQRFNHHSNSGELFAALEKPGRPNWVGQMRGPISTSYKNRAQIALNLGSLIGGRIHRG